MKYQLLVFLFALFLICTPNFLLKKKFILQEIVYSALFSIILYFTYDILKINLETFWYECNGELTKMTSPAPCSQPEPEAEPKPVFYYIKDSAIDKNGLDWGTGSSALFKSEHRNLTDTEFINYALDKMNNNNKMKALVVVYQDNTRKSINRILGKSLANVYNRSDTTTGQVVFFKNLNEVQTKWNKNNPKITMDYKIWNNGY
jgi:hypothetical protein